MESLDIPKELARFFTVQTTTNSQGNVDVMVTEKKPIDEWSGADLPFRTFKCVDKAMDYMKESYHEFTGSPFPAEKDVGQAGGLC